jgi:hypothetical protein
VTYREIWEKACSKGKGGMEDGRPWVSVRVKLDAGAFGCSGPHDEECAHFFVDPGDENGETHLFPCNKCQQSTRFQQDFFWPSNEPLPETEKVEAVNQ